MSVASTMDIVEGKLILKIYEASGVCHEVVIDNSTSRKLRQMLNDRYRELRREKNWNDCPYEGHTDDCTCRGEGGFR